MFVSYETLSRNERRAAKSLAKELLRTVPAAKEPLQWASTRGALLSAFHKPKNLEGVLIYGDGESNWWGDVVLRKGKGVIQFGTCADSPHNSYEEALKQVKDIIASIKCNAREHLLAQRFRETGIDPAEVEVLRIKHPDFGFRWMLLLRDQIEVGAERFAVMCRAPEFANFIICDPQMARHIGGEAEIAKDMARAILFEIGKGFVTDPHWMVSPAEIGRGDAMRGTMTWVLLCAGAYLVRNGVLNISFEEISDVDRDHK